jgi:hypothetical protein
LGHGALVSSKPVERIAKTGPTESMAVSADPKLRAAATQSLHSPDPLAVRAMLCGIGGIALAEFVKAVFLADQIDLSTESDTKPLWR